MQGLSYDAIAAYIFTVDKAVMQLLLPVSFAFSAALCALLARKRRPMEIAFILLATYVGLVWLGGTIFHYALDRPCVRVEVVQLP